MLIRTMLANFGECYTLQRNRCMTIIFLKRINIVDLLIYNGVKKYVYTNEERSNLFKVLENKIINLTIITIEIYAKMLGN